MFPEGMPKLPNWGELIKKDRQEGEKKDREQVNGRTREGGPGGIG